MAGLEAAPGVGAGNAECASIACVYDRPTTNISHESPHFLPKCHTWVSGVEHLACSLSWCSITERLNRDGDRLS